MKKINWRILRVANDDGDDIGSLEELLEDDSADLETLEIDSAGRPTWPDHFLSAPDEGPEWDTPQQKIDWQGFPGR